MMARTISRYLVVYRILEYGEDGKACKGRAGHSLRSACSPFPLLVPCINSALYKMVGLIAPRFTKRQIYRYFMHIYYIKPLTQNMGLFYNTLDHYCVCLLISFLKTVKKVYPGG